jgi:AcrR family transcriptional regulator
MGASSAMVHSKVKDPELVRKKQQQICRGAMRVFRNKGFHAASIREIAKACRMSLGSIYDYIEKKEDILFLAHKMVLDQIYLELDECLRKYQGTVDQFGHLVEEILHMTFRLREEILFIYTETKSLEKRYLYEVLRRETGFVEAIENLIKKGVNEGVFGCSNPHIVANLVAYILAIVPLRGWNVLPHYEEQEVVEQLASLVQKLVSVENRSAGPCE